MVSVVLAVKPFTQVPPRTDGIPKDETGDGSEMPRKHSTSRKKYQEEPKTCSEINKDDAAGMPHWQVKKKNNNNKVVPRIVVALPGAKAKIRKVNM